jgi:hypothetical protein
MPAELNPRFAHSALNSEAASRVIKFFWPDKQDEGLILISSDLTPDDCCFAQSLLVMGLNKTITFIQSADGFNAVSASDVIDRITGTPSCANIQNLLRSLTRLREEWFPNATEHFLLNPNINDAVRRILARDFKHLYVRIKRTGT